MLTYHTHLHFHHHISAINHHHRHHHRHTKPFTTSSLQPHPETPKSTTQNPNSQNPNSQILRTHNSKSSSLLLNPQTRPQNDTVSLSEQEKDAILQLSLVRKRPPQFPGSIYTRPPHGNDLSTPALNTLLREGEDDEEMLIRAVEIRRKVALEIFIEVMVRKGKFGITYSTNLSNRISGFIDLVMIEAALMKKDPEFSRLSFNARARCFIEESKVVPLIRWLKHNSLSYPQIATLISVSKGNMGSIMARAEWLKSVHVKGRSIGIVFLRVGETIVRRSIEELDEIVSYLESKGVRKDWMGYVLSRCAELLAFEMKELETRVSFYTDMGMNDHDFGTMVYDYPKVLGYFTLEEMKQKVNYLKDFGLNNEDVGRLLAFKPQLMACGIEERFKPLLKFFYYLGVNKDGVRKILVVKPVVFCVDLETTIVPKVQFLLDMGIKEDAVGRMLVKFPPLLTYSLYKKIRPVVVFLLTKAGVTQKNIAKVVASAPELLGCSIANKLDGNVKYYLSLGIRLHQLGSMIADFPMLLRYNTELFRPKYRYLRRTMVRPLQDLIEFPRYFSYSLEEKIIPRHKVLVENRVNFKLRYMLATSDEDFHQRVQAAIEKRQNFESGIFRPGMEDVENDDENDNQIETDISSDDAVSTTNLTDD
ncbi:transcription termination factor MTERF2, chloroplastic [Silene latifolia]|uniref:transcription termination factor MTERF2, chloroplastic n=1 Tax=Silene latifolia TaxID=37657 RepID=UPI003D779065